MFSSQLIHISDDPLLPSLDTKVYSALGNHDYHPKSQLPAGPSSIYNQTAEMWKSWLDSGSQRTFKKGSSRLDTHKHAQQIAQNVHVYHAFSAMFLCTGGYYTEMLLNRTGYRVLILNTNLYYDQNKLNQDMDDPAGQFSWADQVLTEAANSKEKAKNLVHLLCNWG